MKTQSKYLLRVSEHQRLQLPPELNHAKFRERLITAVSGAPFDVFTRDRHGIKAAGAVGMVQVGSANIEILPKITRKRDPDQEDATFLFDLLTAAGFLPRIFTQPASTSSQITGAFEIFIRWFSSRLLIKLREGIPRRYSEKTDVLTTLKGKPLLNRIATRTPGSEHLIPVRYAPLQLDNELAQLILSTTNHLLSITRSSQNRTSLSHCAEMLHGVRAMPLTTDLLSRIYLTRLESKWQELVQFAAAILRGMWPTPTTSGRISAFGILFTLDDLFENLLRRILQKILVNEKIRIVLKPWNLHLLRSLDNGQYALKLRPDYLFIEGKDSQNQVLVGDAKWKRLKPSSRSFGLQASDIYQIATYMDRYESSRSILFFPMDSWMETDKDFWTRRFVVLGRESIITIVGVDVAGLVNRDKDRRLEAIEKLRSSVFAAASV
jgi:5-methylcytosine-specific restriction enzyme subunit McrC